MPKRRRGSPVSCTNCNGDRPDAERVSEAVVKLVSTADGCRELLRCVGDKCELLYRDCGSSGGGDGRADANS